MLTTLGTTAVSLTTTLYVLLKVRRFAYHQAKLARKIQTEQENMEMDASLNKDNNKMRSLHSFTHTRTMSQRVADWLEKKNTKRSHFFCLLAIY